MTVKGEFGSVKVGDRHIIRVGIREDYDIVWDMYRINFAVAVGTVEGIEKDLGAGVDGEVKHSFGGRVKVRYGDDVVVYRLDVLDPRHHVVTPGEFIDELAERLLGLRGAMVG